MNEDFHLHFDAFDELVLTDARGVARGNVEAVRAFPITAAEEGVALLDQDGHELAWIPSLKDLDEPRRALVLKKLEIRGFMPEVQQIRSVSTFGTPSTWQVVTDRGETHLVLKAEEDIRRLAASALLISDGRGIQFLIRDVQALDSASRRILDRFL